MSDENFWAFVATIPTDDDLRRALEKMARAQMSRIFRALLDARADLVDALVTSGRAGDASEDMLDDLAEGVVLGGKAHYDGVLSGDIPLPPREQWSSQRAVSWLFDEAFHERFGGGILDDFD